MMSESRAAAADTRHRINYPNSRPRALALVGLGQGGTKIAQRVREYGFAHVQILTAENPSPGKAGEATVLTGMARAIAAEGHRLGQALEKADMIFMVATPTDDLGVAAEIGQLGRQRNILITGVLVAPSATAPQADGALEPLRAATDMLVIVSDVSYLGEMLSELGAQGSATAQTPRPSQ
jgi:hypothetical protein